MEKSMPGGRKKDKQAGLCLEGVRTTRGQWAGSGGGRRARPAGDRKGNSDQMSQDIIPPAELPARMEGSTSMLPTMVASDHACLWARSVASLTEGSVLSSFNFI